MAFCFEVSLEIRDALLAMNMDINYERKNKAKISNLIAAWGLGRISKEKFKAHVRACLCM
jgi:hypothetical protein